MSEKQPKDDKLMEDHEYDGIYELDNPLPGWWLTTFYLTVIFAIIYYIYYELGSGPTLDEELKASMESIQTIQAESYQKQELKTEESLLALASDKEAISEGRAEYVAK
ncbi:MAG: nitrogen fixation protein FixP, partial [Candidatus Dadabacteria bacterium]|nr:nitrogen fixation protein FixP [Candidatus Dadabacteria bacterium]